MEPPKPDPQLYELRLKSYHDSMLALGQRSKRLRAQIDESSTPDFVDLMKGFCELRLTLEHEYNVLDEFIRVHGTDEPSMIVAVAAIVRGYRRVDDELQALVHEITLSRRAEAVGFIEGRPVRF